MIVLNLPWPHSSNNLYLNLPHGRGRTLSPKGRAYHAAVHAAVLEQLRHYPRLTGRLAVTLALNPPDRRRRDIANYEKLACDSLTKAQVWNDDSQIDDMHIIRDEILPGGRVVVTIRELEQA